MVSAHHADLTAGGQPLRDLWLRNTPVLVRGGCAAWPACRTWTWQWLRQCAPNVPVNVEVPEPEDMSGVGVPLQRSMTLKAFVDRFIKSGPPPPTPRPQLAWPGSTKHAQVPSTGSTNQQTCFTIVVHPPPFFPASVQLVGLWRLLTRVSWGRKVVSGTASTRLLEVNWRNSILTHDIGL